MQSYNLLLTTIYFFQINRNFTTVRPHEVSLTRKNLILGRFWGKIETPVSNFFFEKTLPKVKFSFSEVIFLDCPTVISTGRTRQDSDQWFFACKTLVKIWGRKFFWLPRLITWPGISHRNCSKWPKKRFLRITGEPVIIGEKEKNPAFQIRLRLRCKKPFVAI